MNDNKECAILVPCSTYIDSQCDQALRELERRGYPVFRVNGGSAIDVARSSIAHQALTRGYKETLWIDSDIVFHPDCHRQARSHNAPFVVAAYMQKGSGNICHRLSKRQRRDIW